MLDPISPQAVPPHSTPASVLEKQQTPVRWSFVLAWTVAAFAVLLALFAWVPWVYPQVAWQTPFAQQIIVHAQAKRLTELEAKLADVSRLLAEQPTTQQAVVDDAKTQAIKDESIRAVTEAAKQAVAQATTQLTSVVQSQASGAALNAIIAPLTAFRLENRLAQGAAYQAELTQLTPILTAPEKTDLLTLANGGPDDANLLMQLDQQRRGLLAQYRESTATGWWGRVQARLSGLITIKNLSDTDDTAEVTYDKLRMQVAHAATADAVATLSMLPETMRSALQTIETALTNRLRAQAALNAMLNRLVSGKIEGGGIPQGEAQ